MPDEITDRLERIEEVLRRFGYPRTRASLTLGDLGYARRVLSRLENSVLLVYFATGNGCPHCRQEKDMLVELTALSEHLELEMLDFDREPETARKYGVDKVPCTVLVGEKDYGVRYFGLPSGYEFRSFMGAILMISEGDSGLSEPEREKVRRIVAPLHIEVFTTGSCPFSDLAVRTAQQVALENARVTADVIDVVDFPDLAKQHAVLAAPNILVNGSHRFYAPESAADFLDHLLESAEHASG